MNQKIIVEAEGVEEGLAGIHKELGSNSALPRQK